MKEFELKYGCNPNQKPSKIYMNEGEFSTKAKDGKLVQAAVAAKPPHFMSAAECTGAPAIEEMVLDCGSVSAEETEEYYGLGIGSFGAPAVKGNFDEKKGLFFGKAI